MHHKSWSSFGCCDNCATTVYPMGTVMSKATVAPQHMQALVGILHLICWVYHPGSTIICKATILSATQPLTISLVGSESSLERDEGNNHNIRERGRLCSLRSAQLQVQEKGSKPRLCRSATMRCFCLPSSFMYPSSQIQMIFSM
jgi:hypothetical protein